MLKVLDGQELNKFIDVMDKKLDFIARKKLGMHKDSLSDRVFLSSRWLSQA